MVTGTGAELLARFPPRLARPSWPATSAGRQEVLARLLAVAVCPGQSARPAGPAARPGHRAELAGSQPAGTWQDRWLASGAEDQQDWRGCRGLEAAAPGRPAGRLPAAHRRRAAGADLRGCDPPRHRLAAEMLVPPRNLAAEMARTRDRTRSPAGALCQAARAALYPAGGAGQDRGHHGGQGRPGRRDHRRGLRWSCWRSPRRRAPAPTGTPAARSSTSCCAAWARSARTRLRRCGSSAAAASPPASS